LLDQYNDLKNKSFYHVENQLIDDMKHLSTAENMQFCGVESNGLTSKNFDK